RRNRVATLIVTSGCAVSSVGRALPRHGRGHKFKSCTAHQPSLAAKQERRLPRRRSKSVGGLINLLNTNAASYGSVNQPELKRSKGRTQAPAPPQNNRLYGSCSR